MPTRDTQSLANRINELELENRQLRERAAFPALRMRALADAMFSAINDLEQGLVEAPSDATA